MPLTRLLQVKVLSNAFCSEEVVLLLRRLNVCRASECRYVNVSRRMPIIEELAERTGLPLSHFKPDQGRRAGHLGPHAGDDAGKKERVLHQRKGDEGTS